jgi:hypothetical protein
MRGGFGVKEGGQKQGSQEAPSGLSNPLNNPLTNCLLAPYGKGRHLDTGGLAGPRVVNLTRRGRSELRRGELRRAERGIVSMTVEIREQTLLLIPVSLAVGFMVWVLWNWWREEHRTEGRRVRNADRIYSSGGHFSGAQGFQYRSSGWAQERQSDSPLIIENRPKFTPSPQRGQMMRSPERPGRSAGSMSTRPILR